MRHGLNARIHARTLFHGKPRFDFVLVDSGVDDNPWYARLHGLFDVPHDGIWLAMALVHWLADMPAGRTHVPGARTFVEDFTTMPDVIDLRSILKPVRLLTSPLQESDDKVMFVLATYNGQFA